MFRTFNCGVGMIAVVPQSEVEKTIDVLKACGENAWLLGEIKPVGDDNAQVTISE